VCGQGSQAYAKALAKAGILTQEEAETIVEGLDKVRLLNPAALSPRGRAKLFAHLQCSVINKVHTVAA
jgi:hypothetical protein